MKRDWHPEELIEYWALTPGERQQILSKPERGDEPAALDRAMPRNSGVKILDKARLPASTWLGFDLLPRLKEIRSKRLYRPQTGRPDDYARLQPVLSKSIR